MRGTRWLILMTMLVVTLVGRVVGQPKEKRGQYDHAVWDHILSQTVHEGLVDYKAIRARYRQDLTSYLNGLASFDPAVLSRHEQLALYINLYNATMIRAIVERLHEGYSPSENEFSVFKEPLVRTAGKSLSLNDLENKLIRPRFKEPRVHVALVCGARSCPSLLPRAYRGQDLDAVLDANMRRFLHDPARNRIDTKNRRLQLSKIFEWYADDFGGKEAIARYVDRYDPREIASFSVSFLEYRWELNRAANRDP